MGLVVAIGFLTRVPVPRRREALTGTTLARAAVWFPVVGLLVGGVMAGTRAAADLVVDPGPATVFAVLAAIVVTGGFHEDGLADTADAVGAHVSRERRMEILHDSRVGTYGALAVVFAVLLPVVVLTPLDTARFACAALAGHVLGRWSTLPLAWLVPPARHDGAGSLVRVRWPAVVAGTAFAVVAATLLAGPGPGGAALAAAATVALLGAAIAVRSIGGVTGDVYGAVNKLVELSVYAALGAAWT